jgi:molybdopterin/thiamine biosynthesis adenylyltransferase
LTALSSEQLTRYSRHILLPEVGLKGQERLRASSVAIVGLGGLGCPVALYLAAAGVGRLGLLDGDKAELSNLQRQILHQKADIGRLKVESAAEKIQAMDASLKLDLIPKRLEASSALNLLKSYDLVLEGTDNFPSKFLVNDACVSLGKPLVQAGILRFEGQLMSIAPGKSACYRCVFESVPTGEGLPNCSEAGVLGAVAGVMGTLMANEALKILLSLGEPLYDRMLSFDAKRSSFRETALRRRHDCPSCSRAGSGFQPEDPQGLGDASLCNS